MLAALVLVENYIDVDRSKTQKYKIHFFGQEEYSPFSFLATLTWIFPVCQGLREHSLGK